MTGHANQDEFDQLDAYMCAADEEALAALTARIDVEARLRQVLQHAWQLEREAQIDDDG
jgi:hypothetical protein